MAVSFFIQAISDGIGTIFGVLLPKLVDHFDEGKGAVAWIGSLLAGISLSTGPLASILINQFGCRIPCIIGSIVGLLAVALASQSNSLIALIISYGVFGGIGLG